jgi:hypothetical protein
MIILRYAERNFGGKRKNPSRISADGVRAKQLTLLTAPRWPAPVKRSSHYFSTAVDDRVSESGGLAARVWPSPNAVPFIWMQDDDRTTTTRAGDAVAGRDQRCGFARSKRRPGEA